MPKNVHLTPETVDAVDESSLTCRAASKYEVVFFTSFMGHPILKDANLNVKSDLNVIMP